jgi:glutaminyl-tRNA synthetase
LELSASAAELRDRYDLPAAIARVLDQEPVLRALFDDAVRIPRDKAVVKATASLLVNEVLGELRARRLEAAPFGGAHVLELAELLLGDTISAAQTKPVLADMIASGRRPKAVVEEKGLAQIASSDALAPVVDQVLAENADAVGRFKSGNANVFGALVGMVMKRTGGRANAKLVKDLLEIRLKV